MTKRRCERFEGTAIEMTCVGRHGSANVLIYGIAFPKWLGGFPPNTVVDPCLVSLETDLPKVGRGWVGEVVGVPQNGHWVSRCGSSRRCL
jgi:hypothetical protein